MKTLNELKNIEEVKIELKRIRDILNKEIVDNYSNEFCINCDKWITWSENHDENHLVLYNAVEGQDCSAVLVFLKFLINSKGEEIKMTNLKTLNDMYEIGWGELEARALRKARQEAIKWVKALEQEKSKWNYCAHPIDFIMDFFNLTEEDLK